jgi:hypothetical protein
LTTNSEADDDARDKVSTADSAQYFADTLTKCLEGLFSPERPKIPHTEAGTQLLLATVLAEAQRIAPIKLRARLVPDSNDPEIARLDREYRRARRMAHPIELYLEDHGPGAQDEGAID